MSSSLYRRGSVGSRTSSYEIHSLPGFRKAGHKSDAVKKGESEDRKVESHLGKRASIAEPESAVGLSLKGSWFRVASANTEAMMMHDEIKYASTYPSTEVFVKGDGPESQWWVTGPLRYHTSLDMRMSPRSIPVDQVLL